MQIRSQSFSQNHLKRIIISLIIEDFKITEFLKTLENVGFNCESYPDIAFIVFDLMGISKSLQTDDLTAFYITQVNCIRADHREGNRVLDSLAESVYKALKVHVELSE